MALLRLRWLLLALLMLGCPWMLLFYRGLTQLPDVVPVDAELHEIDELVTWMRSQGAFIHRCIRAQRCPPVGGRCMGTTCDLQEGELLISVPLHLQLTAYRSVEGSPCPELKDMLEVAQEWHLKEETLLLLLRLLKERLRGAASPYHRYLSTLPKEYPSVLCDEDEQLKCLEGQPSALHVKRRFARDRAMGTMLLECHVATDESVLRWAELTVYTRAFSGDMGAQMGRSEWNILVPFADIFNDGVEPTAKWRRNSSTGIFEVLATKAVREGSEVLISYGAKSNEKLISRYGFVHEDNPYDVVVVNLKDGDASGPPPSMSLSMGFVEDPASAAFELKHLQAIRLDLSHTGKYADRQQLERAVLGFIRERCEITGRPWVDKSRVSESVRWMCDGSRKSLSDLVGACVEFTSLATASMLRAVNPGAPAVVASEGPRGRLAKVLLDAYIAQG